MYLRVYVAVSQVFQNQKRLEMIGRRSLPCYRGGGVSPLPFYASDFRRDLRKLPVALEASNVDLAKEFTEMITSQRAYQSSARVISTADEMLMETVNLKR